MRFQAIMISLALFGCGSDSAPVAPSTNDKEWQISIVAPSVTDQLVAGATLTCRVRLRAPLNAPAPEVIFASFLRGQALAGEFVANPPKLIPAEKGESTSELEIKVPSKPGKYRLKARVHYGNTVLKDPTTEIEVTVS